MIQQMIWEQVEPPEPPEYDELTKYLLDNDEIVIP